MTATPPPSTDIPPPTDAEIGVVRQQAVGAVKWSAASRTFVQVIQFAGSILLARLLTPSDFGLVALVLVVSNFALILSDLGLGAALVHSRDLTQRKLDTVFWINALVGIVLTAIVAALAVPLAAVYRHPQLTGLLLVSSLIYTLALTIVPLAIMERDLNLRPAAISEVLAAAIGLATSLIAALLGAGAYALVLGPLANVISLTVLYAVATRYIPKGFIGREEFREIWRYSRGLTGFNLVNYLTRNTDDLLLGRFATPAALGFYSRAFIIMLLPVQQIQVIIGRVLFPALTKISHDMPKLVLAHRKSLVISSAICAPLAAGAAACSHDFILAFFGPKWAPMIPMMAILSSTGVQQVFQGTVGTIYQVTGRTDLMFKWNIAFTVATLAAFVIGVQWGAIGMCVAVAVRGWGLLPITLYTPLHLIGDRVRNVVRVLRPLACCLLLEAAAALGMFLLTRSVIGSPALRLLLEMIAGGAAYLIALRLLDRDTLQELTTMIVPAGIRNRLAGSRPSRHRA